MVVRRRRPPHTMHGALYLDPHLAPGILLRVSIFPPMHFGRTLDERCMIGDLRFLRCKSSRRSVHTAFVAVAARMVVHMPRLVAAQASGATAPRRRGAKGLARSSAALTSSTALMPEDAGMASVLSNGILGFLLSVLPFQPL